MAKLEKSPSQSVTYEATGNAEDFSKIITNIDPDLTYFLSNFSEAADAVSLKFGWFTEGLNPPKQNAHVEMTDYVTVKVGSVEGRENTCQHFINTGKVSDAERKVKKLYKPEDEFVRQRTKAFTEHARDIEYAIVNGDVSRLGTETVPPLTGGIPFFMTTEKVEITFDNTTGTAKSSVKHGLKTGDFIYLGKAAGATLPAGLNADILYYIREDAAMPEYAFKLYDTMKDAVEDGAYVAFTTDGSGTLYIVKNNIVDAEGGEYNLDHINNVMQMCYNRGGNPTEAVMSGNKKKRFSVIAAQTATTTRKQSEEKYKNVVSVMETDFGVINAKSHRMYPDNRIDLMDMDYWDLKWFDRTHEVKGLAKKGSYEEFVIESWIGLQGTQPKASGSILNIKR